MSRSEDVFQFLFRCGCEFETRADSAIVWILPEIECPLHRIKDYILCRLNEKSYWEPLISRGGSFSPGLDPLPLDRGLEPEDPYVEYRCGRRLDLTELETQKWREIENVANAILALEDTATRPKDREWFESILSKAPKPVLDQARNAVVLARRLDYRFRAKP